MKRIDLDAERWRTQDDFYAALLSALGAPTWHGHNLDALWDSVVTGDINQVSPPFSVRVVNVPDGELRGFLVSIGELFREARAKGVDVRFVLP